MCDAIIRELAVVDAAVSAAVFAARQRGYATDAELRTMHECETRRKTLAALLKAPPPITDATDAVTAVADPSALVVRTAPAPLGAAAPYSPTTGTVVTDPPSPQHVTLAQVATYLKRNKKVIGRNP